MALGGAVEPLDVLAERLDGLLADIDAGVCDERVRAVFDLCQRWNDSPEHKDPAL